ncbi:hypothetical protein M2275_005998 [Rhodococcus opacus]|nr:hypothetical protein [Rhodococcus opacus]
MRRDARDADRVGDPGAQWRYHKRQGETHDLPAAHFEIGIAGDTIL